VNTKGQLHIDLVEISFKDLPFEPAAIMDANYDKKTLEEKAEGEHEVNKGFFFGVVDSLTSLAYYKFSKFKGYKQITPIAKEGFKWMSQMLDVPLKKMSVKSDSGSEFDWKKYEQWGLKTFIVKQDPFIEGKNSHFQRVLYRIAKMGKTKDIHKLTSLAMKQVNRTQSSITKKAPLDNIKEGQKTLAKQYNKKRGKDSGVKIRLRPLVPKVDKVRIQLLHEKDKGSFYKAYHAKLWSKRHYLVNTKKGNRYTVNRKLYHRDQLRLTEDYDKESEALLKKRDK